MISNIWRNSIHFVYLIGFSVHYFQINMSYKFEKKIIHQAPFNITSSSSLLCMIENISRIRERWVSTIFTANAAWLEA